LQFQAGRRSVEVHGLLSGDLDEGSLHKLDYDCEHIWSQKTISKLPDVAVGLLVDQSGSMSGPKINSARDICIMLAEAVRKIAGVRLYVYGHTANEFGADSMTIFEHYTPRDGENLTRLGGIRAHSNNYDGYAIKDVAKRLSEDQAKKKYLFVIADGETAEKHVTSVCKFTRERLKISTYAFAVGVHGTQQGAFKRQYGDKHVVFVNDVAKCLPQIVRFLRNAMQQERKLVGIGD
jgi:cobalamin biosynthesis protein CobT